LAFQASHYIRNTILGADDHYHIPNDPNQSQSSQAPRLAYFEATSAINVAGTDKDQGSGS